MRSIVSTAAFLATLCTLGVSPVQAHQVASESSTRSVEQKSELSSCMRTSTGFEDSCLDSLAAIALRATNTGRCDIAVHVISSMITIRRDTAYFTGRGRCYGELRRYNEAVVDFDEALKLDSKNVVALSLRTKALMYGNRLMEALASANRLIAMVPESSVAWAARASIFRRMGKEQESFADVSVADLLRFKQQSSAFK